MEQVLPAHLMFTISRYDMLNFGAVLDLHIKAMCNKHNIINDYDHVSIQSMEIEPCYTSENHRAYRIKLAVKVQAITIGLV